MVWISLFILRLNDKIYQTPKLSETVLSMNKVSYQIELEQKDIYELVVGIISRNNQIVELKYDCSYLKNNSNVYQLLADVDVSPADIESCVLPALYEKLNHFKYDAKKDPEYLDLVENHKKQISKQTSGDQKKVFEKEEKDKLDFLKVTGRLRAITADITSVTKELHSKPYYCSKIAINNKGNMFCYSLKEVTYFSDVYRFSQFGLGVKNPLSNNSYKTEIENLMKLSVKSDNKAQYELHKRFLTGNGVDRDVFASYKWLVLASINNNADAQYDLALSYADTGSKLAKYFLEAGIIIPDTGIVSAATNVFANNSTIEREMIASYWFKKAADNGNSKATFEIAKRYEEGLGLEKNKDLATQYYEKAYYSYGNLDAEKKLNKK